MIITYMQAIGEYYTDVQCSSVGDPNIYENIVPMPGSSIPEKAVLDTLIIQKTKELIWDYIKAERDRRKDQGGYIVGVNWYHSDTSSRIQQLGLVIMGAGIPANLYWKTMGGSFVLMTQALALQIFQAAAASDMAIFTVAEQKKAAMLASLNPESYNYLTGTPAWPLIYGE